MRRFLLQVVPGVFVLLFSASLLMADAADAKKATAGEPPLEYTLNIDGKDVAISPDKPITVKMGDRDVQLRLKARAERLLKLPGLSISYPSYYTYESDQDDADAPQWTVQGRDTVLIITGARAPGTAKALEQATVGDVTQKFGKKNVARTTAEINFGGKTITATRLDFAIAGAKLRNFIFAESAGEFTYVIVVQDSPDKDDSTSEETTKLMKLLEQAVIKN